MTAPVTGGPGEPIVNGEAVEVDVRPARVGSRGLALLIDIAVQILFMLVLVMVIGIGSSMLPRGVADGAFQQASVTIAVILVFIAYPTVAETMTNGRSPGKRVLGLRVVRLDGGPIRARHALTRTLVGVAVE